eukprot:scaffold49318_cov33-Tisochrysis_lutea.AAC.3
MPRRPPLQPPHPAACASSRMRTGSSSAGWVASSRPQRSCPNGPNGPRPPAAHRTCHWRRGQSPVCWLNARRAPRRHPPRVAARPQTARRRDSCGRSG